MRAVRQNGAVAGKTSKEIEKRTGESVITTANARALAAKKLVKLSVEKKKVL